MDIFDLSDLFDAIVYGGVQVLPQESKKCPVCGTDLQEIKRNSKFGCPHCYTFFDKESEYIIRKIHGDKQNTAKKNEVKTVSEEIPEETPLSKAQKETERLKAKLKEAVRNEEYEKAAVIRDKISALEKESDGK